MSKLVNIKSVEVLEQRFNQLKKKPFTLHLNASMRLSKDQCPNQTDCLRDEYKQMQTDYRTIVGSCNWLQSTTRYTTLYYVNFVNLMRFALSII